jgi:hypothetical protein
MTWRVLRRPGNEAVHGSGDPYKHLAHRLSSSGQAADSGVIYQADSRHTPNHRSGLTAHGPSVPYVVYP